MLKVNYSMRKHNNGDHLMWSPLLFRVSFLCVSLAE